MLKLDQAMANLRKALPVKDDARDYVEQETDVFNAAREAVDAFYSGPES